MERLLKESSPIGAQMSHKKRTFKRQLLSARRRDISISQVCLGGNREGEIPDPIPNSEVKPFIADGTVHKSTEE